MATTSCGVEPEQCCPQAIGIDTGDFSRVTVRNGVVRRFDCGVQLRGASSLVSELVLRRNSTGVCLQGQGHRITATSIEGGFQGIRASTSGTRPSTG